MGGLGKRREDALDVDYSDGGSALTLSSFTIEFFYILLRQDRSSQTRRRVGGRMRNGVEEVAERLGASSRAWQREREAQGD
jgi:hypothetical protein